MTETPIACSLSSDDMTERMALIDELAVDGLVDRQSTDAGVRVRLRDTPDIEARTRRLIAAEASCCPFMTFDLRRDGGALVLDITGPPEARPVIDMFLAPAGGGAPAAGAIDSH